MKRFISKIKEKGLPSTSSSFIPLVVVVGVVVLMAQMYWVNRNKHMFLPFSIERVRCVTCGGLGVERDDKVAGRLLLCPACFGVGYHSIRRVDDEDSLCPACGGIGRLEADDKWRGCRRCDGRGLVRENPWFVSGSIRSNVVGRVGGVGGLGD